MPRRLGDDPLARARDERAKAVVASDGVAQSGATQNSVQAPSHAPYNAVFFQRRADREAQGPAVPSQEAPEITEISQIPEIREVAAVPTEPAPAAPTVEAVPPPSVSTIPEAATPAPAAVAEAVQVGEVPGSPADGVLPAEAERSGGFFKRLFGKLT